MDAMNLVRRREFLKAAVTTALATFGGSPFKVQAQGAPQTREKLLPFRHSDVRLTGGPLKAQFDRIHAAYLRLNEDQLLKVYRQRAHLPAPGQDMGGWYDAEGFAPGHSFGQYVSGLARFYQATGDTATQVKVRRLAEGYIATIDSDGYSYAGLRASTAFPAYILDKNLIGLLDAYQFADVESALNAARRIVRGAVRYLPDSALERDEMPRQAPYDEAYTLPENLFYAYELTGDREMLDLAKQFLFDRRYFEPLARGVNVLPGLHAYSHVNCLSSAARAYLHLGNPMHLRAIQNAWNMIEKTQQFASGGWGPNEAFVVPDKGLLGESLKSSHAHFETPCGAYAHFKLARYLLRLTADSRYGDGMERVLYNTVLGAKDPKGDGHFFYYSDYHASAQKDYHADKWPCCSGTLPQAVADYVINCYFQSNDGIYVNLFVPSEVRGKIQGVPAKIVQATDYPQTDSTELRLELPAPTEFTVYIRIPNWLRSAAEISVNNKPVSVAAEPGTFAAIRRRWQHNDAIQVQLPFSFRTEPIDEQHPQTVALMRGPLMMVALDPQVEVPQNVLTSPDGLKPSAHSRAVSELQQQAASLRFTPFYAVGGETYTSYITQK